MVLEISGNFTNVISRPGKFLKINILKDHGQFCSQYKSEKLSLVRNYYFKCDHELICQSVGALNITLFILLITYIYIYIYNSNILKYAGLQKSSQ